MRGLQLALAAALLAPLLLATAPNAAADPAEAAANEVGVGIFLINFGNYDVGKGTYVVDFYLWFRWDLNASGPAYDPRTYEFMNGRASSTAKIFNSTTVENGTTTYEVWYRVQANLQSNPQFKQYPYDTQHLTIEMEDSVLPIRGVGFTPLHGESGVASEVRVSGFLIRGWTMRTVEYAYPWGETYSRLVFDVTVDREPASTSAKVLLPVLVFSIVAGLAFLFPPDKVGQRFGLGTSMLISSVMFHLSQVSALPPTGTLILMDKIMISAYGFIATSLIITTLIQFNEDHWKREGWSVKINRQGAFLSLVLPFAVFGVLALA